MYMYSTAQMQLNKQVRATHKLSQVTQRALASHSRVLYATHASAKGVNCAACGSEIACVSASCIASVSSAVSASSVPRLWVKFRERLIASVGNFSN